MGDAGCLAEEAAKVGMARMKKLVEVGQDATKFGIQANHDVET
jgi:hypothetical protein